MTDIEVTLSVKIGGITADEPLAHFPQAMSWKHVRRTGDNPHLIAAEIRRAIAEAVVRTGADLLALDPQNKRLLEES